ncbi:MAG: flagellar biosynthesis protein FlhB [Rubrivivax sp.]|nr:flagellar biosynthesis protein FlhB [Rubrivivax sp.]
MSGPDRHLPASDRKIQRAREEGQLARSRDLGHFAALATGVAVFVGSAPWLLEQVQRIMVGGLRFDHAALGTPQLMLERLAGSAWPTLAVIGALGGALLAAALFSGVVVGGWNWSLQAAAPKWSKLDPLAGFARMFSPDHIGPMLKSCVLALIVGGVGAAYLHNRWPALTSMLAVPLQSALALGLDLVRGGLLMLLLPLLAFAVIDVPLQRQLLLRRLRMSHEELKKEHKDVEGNVAVKAKMRARMREMANRRMIAAVPGADLVVMNPTHYAVALKYDDATMNAPKVVAKGADLLAMRIRDVAKEAGVPVLQAAPLARALYAHTELDQEIPARLFAAVAQVLAWVFQLKRAAGFSRTQLLATPPQPAVPEDLDPDSPRAQAPGDAGTPRTE